MHLLSVLSWQISAAGPFCPFAQNHAPPPSGLELQQLWPSSDWQNSRPENWVLLQLPPWITRTCRTAFKYNWVPKNGSLQELLTSDRGSQDNMLERKDNQISLVTPSLSQWNDLYLINHYLNKYSLCCLHTLPNKEPFLPSKKCPQNFSKEFTLPSKHAFCPFPYHKGPLLCH